MLLPAEHEVNQEGDEGEGEDRLRNRPETFADCVRERTAGDYLYDVLVVQRRTERVERFRSIAEAHHGASDAVGILGQDPQKIGGLVVGDERDSIQQTQ